MKKDNIPMMHIPVYWEKIVACIVCAFGVLALMYFDIDAANRRTPHELLLCVCLFGAVCNAVSHDIREDFLVSYCCGIPIRCIDWEKIHGAFYISPKKSKRTNNDRTTVVFFLTPFKQTVNVLTEIEFHAMEKKQKIKPVKVLLPIRNKDEYIGFIEQCLGRTLEKIERT